jgi:hypothetical protein
MFVGRAVPTVVLSLVILSPAAAQTPDPIFAGYRFAPPGVGSRPAGLGGAFVAVADETKAAVVNPAGLTLIPLTEVALSSGERWAAAASGRPWIRLAGYVTRAEEVATGTLGSTTWEGGLAVGARPLRRVSLGAGVAWSRLSLERRTSESEGETSTFVSSEDTHVRFTVGMLLDLLANPRRSLPALRLGVSFQPGFDWSVPVQAAAAAGPVDLRRPSVVAAGLAYRPTDRWSLSLQGDLIRYREVEKTLRRNAGDAAQSFSLPNVVEPRFGAEFSAPLWCGCGVVKIRGGLHHRSAGTLRYGGTDPVLARTFAGDQWETVATLGGSFFSEYFGHALRLDIDSKDLFHGPDLSFGLVFRF